MNKLEQRIAIAKSRGWIWVENHCYKNISFMGSKSYGDGWKSPKTGEIYDDIESLPDYLNDFNAMHEALIDLNTNKVVKFVFHLYKIVCVGSLKRDFRYYAAGSLGRLFHSTAEQWAEAYLRSIGEWKD